MNVISRAAIALILSAGFLSAGPQGEATPDASWDSPDSSGTKVAADGRSMSQGELLVSCKGTASPAVLFREIEAQGGAILGFIPRLRVARVGLPQGSDELEAVHRYERLSSVEYACPNEIGGSAGGESVSNGMPPPNDPEFRVHQWDLRNVGQWGAKFGADIEILRAWELETGSDDVVIAVIDSGVNYLEPDLQGRLLPGYDFVDEDPDASDPSNPSTSALHGTAVAGRIAANTNNSLRMAGVDWRCRILPVRVVKVTGFGTLFDLLQGVDFATSSDAQIVNMSLVNYSSANQLLAAALKAARAAGKCLVAAAGNGGGGHADVSWPGASSDTISVGMTKDTDEIGFMSGTGSAVDFSAPGHGVSGLGSGSSPILAWTGTSFAAPQLAAVIALMKARNPYLSQTTSYKLLMRGSEDQVGLAAQDTPGWDPTHGHGRLNAFRTLSALLSTDVPQPLMASPPQLSVVEGGVWVLDIDAGPECGGDVYWLLGSASGTEPGTDFGQTHFPLNIDDYFRFCALHPNTWPVSGNFGTLDDRGRARVTVTLPAGLIAAAGARLHHAFAVYEAGPARPWAKPPKVVSVARAVRVGAAPEVVFADTFQSSGAYWFFEGSANASWHITDDGECGAVGNMLGFTAPDNECNVATLGGAKSTALSPEFVLTGTWPYRLSFDQIRDVDDVGDKFVTTIRILDASGELTPQTIGDPDLLIGERGELTHVELELPHGSKFVGRTIRLEFGVSLKLPSLPGTGWMIDNLVVRNDGNEPMFP